MLLILAARAKTRTELAEKLEIHKSTITRTCEKIQRMISTLGLRGLESSPKQICRLTFIFSIVLKIMLVE